MADPPKYRTTGPALVVCQKDSKARLKRLYKGKGKKTRKELKRKLKLLKKCRFKEIQPAGSVHRLGSAGQPAPGRMRLVRPPARALAVAAALLAGCGGSQPKSSGPLQWKDTPILTVAAETLPDDRILAGTVVNVGFGSELELDATKVVRDAAGKKLEAFALFSHTYAHGLYGASEAPDGPLGEDRRRLGFVRRIRQREEAPLTVAYRLTRETRPPLTVDYGEGRLPVPGSLTEDRG